MTQVPTADKPLPIVLRDNTQNVTEFRSFEDADGLCGTKSCLGSIAKYHFRQDNPASIANTLL
jgi:hypothetical protein